MGAATGGRAPARGYELLGILNRYKGLFTCQGGPRAQDLCRLRAQAAQLGQRELAPADHLANGGKQPKQKSNRPGRQLAHCHESSDCPDRVPP